MNSCRQNGAHRSLMLSFLCIIVTSFLYLPGMRPKFYSKQAIALLTVVCSPLFGCILFSYNLKEVGRKKVIPLIFLGLLALIGIVRRGIAEVSNSNLMQFLLTNAVFSLFLTLLWEVFFKNYPEYEQKKVWKPVAIFLSICMALLAFQLLTSK